jgi:hypothetical protein
VTLGLARDADRVSARDPNRHTRVRPRRSPGDRPRTLGYTTNKYRLRTFTNEFYRYASSGGILRSVLSMLPIARILVERSRPVAIEGEHLLWVPPDAVKALHSLPQAFLLD